MRYYDTPARVVPKGVPQPVGRFHVVPLRFWYGRVVCPGPENAGEVELVGCSGCPRLLL